MARVCALTGKKVLYGHNVSHANNKSNRRFLPNLQNTTFLSDCLGIGIIVRTTTHGIRCVEKAGGIDNYLLRTDTVKLSAKMRKFKKTLSKKTSKTEVRGKTKIEAEIKSEEKTTSSVIENLQ